MIPFDNWCGGNMNYTDYSVIKEGARSYNLTLPCFSDEKRFYDAVRMNRFYEAIMGKLYLVGEHLINTDERRLSFSCSYEVKESNKIEEVELIVSIRYSSRRTYRKSILHVWDRGYIVSQKVSDKF